MEISFKVEDSEAYDEQYSEAYIPVIFTLPVI
jgi:hypothetical protein